jgi:ATP-dependent protease HslVU (ClpYQ) peptidase subunit
LTTIVASFSLGGIAADTRVTGDNSFYPARKVFRIQHPSFGESILGTAGHGAMCILFLEWFKSAKRDPLKLHEMIGKDAEWRDEISILELNKSGLYYWTGWGYGEPILRDSHAVGSGGAPALEALRRGASLEDAVTSAMGHDEYSGCDVQSEYLSCVPPELLPKKRRRRG